MERYRFYGWAAGRLITCSSAPMESMTRFPLAEFGMSFIRWKAHGIAGCCGGRIWQSLRNELFAETRDSKTESNA